MATPNTAALWAALEALREDPDSRDRVVSLGDGKVRVERTPEPGVKLRLTPADSGAQSEPWVARTFEPADSPPGAYPGQLPFVADIPVMVWEGGRSQTMIALWSDAPKPQALLSSLLSASREQGWAGIPPVEVESRPPQFTSLSRGRGRRVIAFLNAQGKSILTVSDSFAD